jgi:hypothetical protein
LLQLFCNHRRVYPVLVCYLLTWKIVSDFTDSWSVDLRYVRVLLLPYGNIEHRGCRRSKYRKPDWVYHKLAQFINTHFPWPRCIVPKIKTSDHSRKRFWLVIVIMITIFIMVNFDLRRNVIISSIDFIYISLSGFSCDETW